jgi:hypothetical protein
MARSFLKQMFNINVHSSDRDMAFSFGNMHLDDLLFNFNKEKS